MDETIKRMYDETVGFKYLHPVSPIQQVKNLAKEAPKLIKSGFSRVPNNIYQARMVMCESCYYWHASGNLGLGKCEHPKCGCTRGKMRMSASACPIGNWGEHHA